MDFNRCIDANDVMEGVGVFTHAAKTGGIPVSTCIHFITGMHYPIIWCSRCSIFPIDIHRWDGSPPLLNVVEGNMAGTPLDPATQLVEKTA
jgi:hypothetical protein